MKTITCGANHVEVAVVDSIGGFVNETTAGDDTLYRDKSGNYYIETRRVKARQGRPNLEAIKVRPASPLAAMLWYVQRFIEDKSFAELFRDRLTGGYRAEVIAMPEENPAQLRMAL